MKVTKFDCKEELRVAVIVEMILLGIQKDFAVTIVVTKNIQRSLYKKYYQSILKKELN